MNDWPKLSGETDAQYVYRVCRSKDEIGTWTDVANVINTTLGWDKGECAYRKTWKAYRDLQQVSDSQNDGSWKRRGLRCVMSATRSVGCFVQKRVVRVCVS